jgi:hypothetical protein
MTNYDDVDEKIRQQFLLLHLAWEDAHWLRKKDPTDELRKYLHVLGGISATWQGILKSDQYYKVSPNMVLDSGLTRWVSWDICNILVNTHPKYQIPESLGGEIQELAIEILELHVLSDVSPDKIYMQSLESLIHVLNMKSDSGWKVADRAVKQYASLVNDEVFGAEFQSLVDLIGPSVDYAEYTFSEQFDSIPQYWANDLYRDYQTDGLWHYGCGLCYGPNSPEVVAILEIEELEKREQKS